MVDDTTRVIPLPENTPVTFLMGATACGKTALSLTLADTLNAEIISVDSALVYRGMNVGTAKPTVAEQAGIPHHLIDIRDPWESYSAAEFCNDANMLIAQIHARGKRVLLVGGTMLYFKALEEGLAELPEADPIVRAQLVQEAAEKGWASMHEQLRGIDPAAAQRIHPNDPQRLQRALEVYRLTGVALSELQRRTKSQLMAAPEKYALIPGDRAWLHQRIEQRFAAMVDAGLLSEVLGLRADDRLHAALPSMRSVGYRQVWEYLDTQDEPLPDSMPNDAGAQEWTPLAVAATRQLAKRQLTWLRSMANVTTIECNTVCVEDQVALVTTQSLIST